MSAWRMISNDGRDLTSMTTSLPKPDSKVPILLPHGNASLGWSGVVPIGRMLRPFASLFVSIDEVHVLYSDRKRANSKYNLYARFKSVLNDGVSYVFGVICMSTVSDVATIATSRT